MQRSSQGLKKKKKKKKKKGREKNPFQEDARKNKKNVEHSEISLTLGKKNKKNYKQIGRDD